MARNTVAVMASAIVARLRVAMPKLRSALAASQQPMRRRGRKVPHQGSFFASAVAAELSRHFASTSRQFPSSRLDSRPTSSSDTVEKLAAAIVAQLAPTMEREDLPLETIEI
jgi:hypothetical protein